MCFSRNSKNYNDNKTTVEQSKSTNTSMDYFILLPLFLLNVFSHIPSSLKLCKLRLPCFTASLLFLFLPLSSSPPVGSNHRAQRDAMVVIGSPLSLIRSQSGLRGLWRLPITPNLTDQERSPLRAKDKQRKRFFFFIDRLAFYLLYFY